MDLAIREKDSMLLVIDVQERLAPAMEDLLYARLLENVGRIGAARNVLDLPVVVTEQYPKGLGPTVEPIKTAMAGVEPLAKISFSAAKDDGIRRAIEATGRSTVIIAGMETHVCVYQTARDLAQHYQVHVLADAVASRARENFEVGLRLIEKAGAVVTSTETVLFDLLERAGTDAFKTVSRLVR